MFGEAGVDAIVKELKQLHSMQVMTPCHPSDLSKDEVKRASGIYFVGAAAAVFFGDVVVLAGECAALECPEQGEMGVGIRSHNDGTKPVPQDAV